MRAWLQLVRLPAVFTTFADVFLGFLLSDQTVAEAPARLALLMVSSLCLYMAGMVLNDVFDHEVDARERPMRPIPSGRIPLKSAATFGAALVIAGILIAALAGVRSLIVAAALAGAVLLYDGFLKKTPLGPLGMGACRLLNVLLGASLPSAGAEAIAGWPIGVWGPAASLGLYIVGVTLFAKNEAEQSRRGALVLAMLVVAAGLAALTWSGTRAIPDAKAAPTLFAFGVIAELLLLQLAMTCAAPSPERVQGAVKLLLMTYVILDATLIFAKTGDPVPALITAGLLIPATIAGRWLYVT